MHSLTPLTPPLQYAIRAFADALDDIPMALADNSGLSPITELSAVKAAQIRDSNPRLGVDCMQLGSNGAQRTLCQPLVCAWRLGF